MIIIAVIFWVLIALAVLGGIISVVQICKGEKDSSSSGLPEPIRRILRGW
jgi:hypothetical protein